MIIGAKIESGNKPIPSVSELEEMGFKLVIFPSMLLLTATRIMRDALLEFRKTGELMRHVRGMVSINEFKDIMGWDKF